MSFAQDVARRGTAARLALYSALALVGLAAFFPRVVASGFRVAGGAPIDTRHAAFVLEWGWLCATRQPICRDVWSPPVFHPEPETLTLSEPLLGLQPFYGPWRTLGASPSASELGAKALLLLATYAAALWLLRRTVGLSPGPAAMGAFVAAFGAPRSAQMDHILLFGQAASLLSLAALAVALGDVPPRRGRIAVLAAGLFAAVQLWSGIYLSWISALVLALAAILALASRSNRVACLRTLRRDSTAWLLAPLLALLTAAPLLAAFARRMTTHEGEAPERLKVLLPTLTSWIDPGNDHLLWGEVARRLALGPEEYSWEHALGLGVATTLIALVGAPRLYRRAELRPLLLAALLSMAAVTRWPGGFAPWETLANLIPGATAIRSISRLGVVLLPLWGLAVGFGFAELSRRWSRLTLVLVGLLVLSEPARWHGVFRSRHFERRINMVAQAALRDSCAAFLLTPGREPARIPVSVQLDAMFASLATGIPTLNGYSSYSPLNWDLRLLDPQSEAERESFAIRARWWTTRHGLDPGRVCWIRSDFESRGPLGVEVLPLSSAWLPQGRAAPERR